MKATSNPTSLIQSPPPPPLFRTTPIAGRTLHSRCLHLSASNRCQLLTAEHAIRFHRSKQIAPKIHRHTQQSRAHEQSRRRLRSEAHVCLSRANKSAPSPPPPRPHMFRHPPVCKHMRHIILSHVATCLGVASRRPPPETRVCCAVAEIIGRGGVRHTGSTDTGCTGLPVPDRPTGVGSLEVSGTGVSVSLDSDQNWAVSVGAVVHGTSLGIVPNTQLPN